MILDLILRNVCFFPEQAGGNKMKETHEVQWKDTSMWPIMTCSFTVDDGTQERYL